MYRKKDHLDLRLKGGQWEVLQGEIVVFSGNKSEVEDYLDYRENLSRSVKTKRSKRRFWQKA